MTLPLPNQARLRCTRQSGPSPDALLPSLARQPGPAVLESTALHPTHGRWSIYTCRPMAVLTWHDGRLHCTDGEGAPCDPATPTGTNQAPPALWDALAAAFGHVRLHGSADAPGGYAPGWIGYVGYEVGRSIERLPGRARRDTPLPDLRLAFHDALLVFDGVERTWWRVELCDPTGRPWTDTGHRLAGLLEESCSRVDICTSVNKEEVWAVGPFRAADAADARRQPAVSTESNFTPEEYRHAVARAVQYIAAGDIFQVNLSQRLTTQCPADPWSIYARLRRRNPAWYSAMLPFRAADGSSCAILSTSPELFLRQRARTVLTRPIKGTRPRGGHPETDRAASAQLLASPKDNAELAMIIDLLRNDLGRVCTLGSVRVRSARTLETHPTVFHLVGEVAGQVREDVGPAELLRATFPGGSITGAPKIRAMEIIDELEGLARGAYTGSIGIVSVGGESTWNIAIRTLLLADSRAMLGVGGGIVAESTPENERLETLHKARALLEALRGAREI